MEKEIHCWYAVDPDQCFWVVSRKEPKWHYAYNIMAKWDMGWRDKGVITFQEVLTLLKFGVITESDIEKGIPIIIHEK